MQPRVPLPQSGFHHGSTELASIAAADAAAAAAAPIAGRPSSSPSAMLHSTPSLSDVSLSSSARLSRGSSDAALSASGFPPMLESYATEGELLEAMRTKERQRRAAATATRGNPDQPFAGSASLLTAEQRLESSSSDADDIIDPDARTPHDDDMLDRLFHPIRHMRVNRIRWQQSILCSPLCVKRFFMKILPCLHWLPKYNVGRDGMKDLMAGMMLSVVLIPQGMAYAQLAAVPPVYGLYACIMPPLLYAFLGGSKEMHIGVFALVSLLVADAVRAIAPPDAPTEYQLAVAFSLGFYVGLILISMSILRLGFAVGFLADCVLSAYICSSAMLIMTSQWKAFFGLTDMERGLSFIGSYQYIFGHMDAINWASVSMGLLSILIQLAVDELNKRLGFRVPIPSQLMVVILGTLISFAGDLNKKFDVHIVGDIPRGLPSFEIPHWDNPNYLPESQRTNTTEPLPPYADIPPLTLVSNISLFIQHGFTIALIAYIISISIAKNFANKENERRRAQRAKREEERQGLLDGQQQDQGPGQEQENEQEQPRSPDSEGVGHTAQNGSISTNGSSAIPIHDPASPHPSANAHTSSSPPTSTDDDTDEEYVIDANQELLALGICNFFGCFTQAYPVAGSLSRSALVASAGVKSSLHNVVSVSMLILVLLLFTPLLYYLPKPCLAAIVIVALKSLLLQVRESVRLFHLRKSDFLMWLFTFVATLLFGTQIGIAIGVLISLAMLLKQTSRPPVATLGRLGHTDLYRNIRRFPAAKTFRNIVIWRFDAPLHFANKDYFKEKLIKAIRKAEEAEWEHIQATQPLPEDTDQTHAPALVGRDQSHPSLHFPSRSRSHHRGYEPVVTTLKTQWDHMSASRSIYGAKSRADPNASQHDATSVDDPSDTTGGQQLQRGFSLHEAPNIALHREGLMSASPSPSVSPSLEQSEHATHVGSSASSSASSSSPSSQHTLPASADTLDALAASLAPLPASSSYPATHFSISTPLTRADCRIYYVVLDCSGIIDIDDAALTMLRALPSQLQVTLIFCAMKSPVRSFLDRTGFFKEAMEREIEVIHQAEIQSGTDHLPEGARVVAPRQPFRPRKPSVERPFVSVHQAVRLLEARRKAEEDARILKEWEKEAHFLAQVALRQQQQLGVTVTEQQSHGNERHANLGQATSNASCVFASPVMSAAVPIVALPTSHHSASSMSSPISHDHDVAVPIPIPVHSPPALHLDHPAAAAAAHLVHYPTGTDDPHHEHDDRDRAGNDSDDDDDAGIGVPVSPSRVLNRSDL